MERYFRKLCFVAVKQIKTGYGVVKPTSNDKLS